MRGDKRMTRVLAARRKLVESLPRDSQSNYRFKERASTQEWGCQARNGIITGKVTHAIQVQSTVNWSEVEHFSFWCLKWSYLSVRHHLPQMKITKLSGGGGEGGVRTKRGRSREGSFTWVMGRLNEWFSLPNSRLDLTSAMKLVPPRAGVSRQVPDNPPFRPLSFPFSLFKASDPPHSVYTGLPQSQKNALVPTY